MQFAGRICQSVPKLSRESTDQPLDRLGIGWVLSAPTPRPVAAQRKLGPVVASDLPVKFYKLLRIMRLYDILVIGIRVVFTGRSAHAGPARRLSEARVDNDRVAADLRVQEGQRNGDAQQRKMKRPGVKR